MQTIITVEPDGTIGDKSMNLLRVLLRAFAGKDVSLTAKRYAKQRSNPQNRYYYGVVLPIVVTFFKSYGNDVSPEEVHEYLKREVGGLVKDIVLPDGSEYRVTQSSTEADKLAWEDWMTAIRTWASKYQVFIPLPNEVIDNYRR